MDSRIFAAVRCSTPTRSACPISCAPCGNLPKAISRMRGRRPPCSKNWVRTAKPLPAGGTGHDGRRRGIVRGRLKLDHGLNWEPLQRGISMNKFAALNLALAVSLLWSVPCFSHAKLQSSVPAANAQLAYAPPTLTLNFSEHAQLGVLRLISSGTTVPVTLD